MFFHNFLIPALNEGKGMQLHEPRHPILTPILVSIIGIILVLPYNLIGTLSVTLIEMSNVVSVKGFNEM
jgi:hypothetical protein